MAPSFGNPIQIDVSSILTVDTVANGATGGAVVLPTGQLTSMDGSGYDFYTTSLHATGGLPSSALFANSGVVHPVVQLHYSDTGTAPNSVLLNGPAPNAGETLSFDVPQWAYDQLQIYGTSTEGASALSVTLTYTDQTTSTMNLSIPDWGSSGSASGGVFVLASGLARLGSGTYEGNTTFALYGANVNPSTIKTLASVSITHTGTSGRFVFYGATGF